MSESAYVPREQVDEGWWLVRDANDYIAVVDVFSGRIYCVGRDMSEALDETQCDFIRKLDLEELANPVAFAAQRAMIDAIVVPMIQKALTKVLSDHPELGGSIECPSPPPNSTS